MSKLKGHHNFIDYNLIDVLLQYPLCLVILIIGSNIFAGSINPDLATKLKSSAPLEMINVEIAVAGGISANELNAHLDSTCETLSDRRREGVLYLQARARETQADLLNYFEELQAEGIVSNIKSHWLTNTISVDIVMANITAVAQRPDVKEIFQYPDIVPIEPDERFSGTFSSTIIEGGVEENIKYIGADSTWRMGYTGEGRIVCHFDGSGIEGKHPALISGWKGNDGNPDAAWVGLWTDDGYPAPRNLDSYHGTHVMGIMVGHDDATGDTIGVAPGAEWIGVRGYGWEWAANPDGNPYTTDDVPDVINISFGTSGDCWDRYWDLIDMTEALGIVNIMAAGNRGDSPYSVESPASRALDSLTNFAVGSIDHRSGLISRTSSRGPSNCDSISIKPNVTAPGLTIRSSVPGGMYDYHGGTSMAAPHVSGAVAILRQYAPNASVREIKEALLAGCTPRGTPSPNNNYGWGVINIPASIEYLSSQFKPDIKVKTFEYTQSRVPDTISGILELKNRGYHAGLVYVLFDNDQNGVTVLSDSIHYGDMDLNQSCSGNVPFKAIFDDTMFAGSVISIGYSIRAANGYSRLGHLSLQAGIEGERQYYTHSNSDLQFTVSNFGTYRDFKWSDTSHNRLYEAALLVGTDYNSVSDGFRNTSLEPDDDFWYDANNDLQIGGPGDYADQETVCIFDDGKAENHIGIQIKQHSYSWDSPPNNNFILLEYEITNISNNMLEGLCLGLALDWTYGYPNYDVNCEGNISKSDNLGYTFQHINENDSSLFLGAAVLNKEGVLSYQVIPQYIDGYVQGPGISDSAKFGAMADGLIDTNRTTGTHESIMHIISTGPFSLPPGESDTVFFAVLGAESLGDLKASAVRAREKVQSMIWGDVLPDLYKLRQNYPNPFNSATTIEFVLRVPGSAKLEIFNILGQKVATLADNFLSDGYYSMDWNGITDFGESVASGIYIYRLKIGDYSEAKKMILLK